MAINHVSYSSRLVFNGTQCFNLSEPVQFIGVILTGVMSSLVLIFSGTLLVVVLFFTHHSETFTIVCVNSLCLADALCGSLYGLVKVILVVLDPPWVTCFLAESILFCSRLAVGFTLVMWMVDLCIYVRGPQQYRKSVEHKLMMFVLVFFWNCAIVIGLMPQNTWDNGSNGDKFFNFHSGTFIAMKCGIIMSCLIITVVCVFIIGRTTRTKADQPAEVAPSTSTAEFCVSFRAHDSAERISALVLPCRPLVAVNCLLELPQCMYELLHSDYGPLFGVSYSDTVMSYLQLLVFVRSYAFTVILVRCVPEIHVIVFRCLRMLACGEPAPCCAPCKRSAAFDVSKEKADANRTKIDLYRLRSKSSPSIQTLSSTVTEATLATIDTCPSCGSMKSGFGLSASSLGVQPAAGGVRDKRTSPHCIIHIPPLALIPGHHHHYDCPMYGNRSSQFLNVV